jgi:uncharacterized membrane protein SirB2
VTRDDYSYVAKYRLRVTACTLALMSDFYIQIKWIHMMAVMTSGMLFLIRGLLVNLGVRWPMAAPVRYLTYTVDTILLTAALMLTTIVHQYPFVNAWLTTKVLLLVVYIVLGTFALKQGRTPKVRWICYIAALIVFAFIVSVARAHNPLGVFA